MDAIVVDRFLVHEESSTEPASFEFSSPHRSLSAFGIGEMIHLPALGAGRPGFPLQEAVQGALERARLDGQDDPIVVGAIPFDLARPSVLFVPERWAAVPGRLPGATPPTALAAPVIGRFSSPDRGGFEDAVRQAVETIRDGAVRKVVLSRILDIELARPVTPGVVRAALGAQNPGGFHFSLPLPDGSTLVGASPELLIRKTGRAIFANPLAGSARRQADPAADDSVAARLLASDKDVHEHRFVTAGIRRVLAPLCRRLDIPDRPGLMNTPTMWHLSTSIAGDLADDDMSVLRLACLMHPTAAVCGAPTAEAQALIRRLEPFDRGLFSGIVGWCNAAGDGEWAITIRCGTIDGRHVRLFAGAGIVEGSDPASEWAETGAKLGTMLRAFGIDGDAP